MQELTRIALIGTAKQSSSGTADDDHPAESLVAAMGTQAEEPLLLLRVGARSLYEQCGLVARSDISALSPAPEDDRCVAPPSIIGVLQNAIATDSRDVLIEFLQQLDDSKLLLPPELLPQALGVSNVEVRQHLLPVIGRRGHWLGELNDEWHWVVTGITGLSSRNRDVLQRQWDDGTFSERCEALKSIRRADASEGREWLEDVIDQEKADHRIALLGTLEAGLSIDDERLLESRLDDRSDKVRRLAASLLARLLDSALAQRMRARAEELLTATASGKRLRVECHPPEKIDKAWHRDGVPRKIPPGRGKRAVWTETILSDIPPSHWANLFDAEPTQLIDGVRDDDFAQPILVAWTRAAVAFAPRDDACQTWLRPLWDYWLEVEKRTRDDKGKRPVMDHLQHVLEAMPTAEDAFLPVIKAAVASGHTQLLGLLPVLPRPWSETFGANYLHVVRGVLRKYSDNRAYQWAGTLFTAGRALRRANFHAALEPWQVPDADGHGWHTQAVSREIEKFRETINTRKLFYDEVMSGNQTHPRREANEVED